MQKSSGLFWTCLAGLTAVVCFGGFDASAAGRSMAGGDSARAASLNTARMPSMPTMSINTIGTHSASGVAPTPAPNPGPTPGPTPGTDPVPNPDPAPTPSSCPDGGPVNSDYTVDACMQALTRCAQSSLPNGLNDLFNEDMRNSVINGMGLCASDVDKCIRDVRVDCQNVYLSLVDVWLDFNSRVVQPEYFNFVMRKTGLTPNQAKNVCELLDRNTYGKSFAAVSADGNRVTSEYNKEINAYNGQGGNKNQTMGAEVNKDSAVDGSRGYYARWDATNGICKIRVAAYNKDELITNKWLFGAAGDNKAAEAWQDAGSTFTCNKDLFDFSLMNNTATMAVVGIGGGALVGAGIGALAGHGARDFDCSASNMREELFEQIRSNKKDEMTLNLYLESNIPIAKSDFDESQCEAIKELYEDYVNLGSAIVACETVQKEHTCAISANGNVIKLDTCAKVNAASINGTSVTYQGTTYNNVDASGLQACKDICEKNSNASLVEEEVCSFKNKFKTTKLESQLCTGGFAPCNSVDTAKKQQNDLRRIFDKLKLLTEGQKSNRVKTTLIGTGVGAAAGGVATAITAFVERNNINCRVGDGLNTVAFGKSFTIGTLKDYYVKWNLHVADSVLPKDTIKSCQQWVDACAMYGEDDCGDVEVNYQRPGRNTSTTIKNACVMKDGTCIENRPVAVSYGACPRAQGQNGSNVGIQGH